MSEEIKKLVIYVYDSMIMTYGDLFAIQFTADKTPGNWKSSLYKRTYGCSETEIINGFESLMEVAVKMPSLDEIVEAIQAEHKKSIGREQARYIDPISTVVDRLERQNFGNSIAGIEIAKMRASLLGRK